MTTQGMISEWFDKGIKEGATHMLVVCDEFDWEDYPVMVLPTENVLVVMDEYTHKSMQKVMEVYNLQMEKQPQIEATRCFQA